LSPSGIGEEQGIVAGAVVRILGRRIEDTGACSQQHLMQPVDILAACGVPGEMMKAGAVTVMDTIRPRRFQADRADKVSRDAEIPVDAG
jgi:hypothetical protein